MQEFLKAKLHITGIVQGVGFRPFVFRLAKCFNLKGWVRNTSSGVDIEVDGAKSILDKFITAIKSNVPPLARIDAIEVWFSIPGGFKSFEIIHSEKEAGGFQPISPDVCICEDCLRELFDPSDRRYRYPFINCTNCGPRFTIIIDIPYDRPKTTMASFAMCSDCEHEYKDPSDRRFHAQPLACPICGPAVWLENPDRDRAAIITSDKAISEAARLMSEGKILAIKGLGGFHLACDATNEVAVTTLRERKLRAEKPFALMMPDIPTILQHCYINKDEIEYLQSHQRPIVLLQRRSGSGISVEVAPQQHNLGVMLPYSPLHYLLFQNGYSPLTALVMTSGNLSEEPIATDNEEARERLAGLADAFLMHNRKIQTRCDDSVGRILFAKKQKTFPKFRMPVLIRRSRGFAPDPISLPFDVPPILAVGPELKNTFCLSKQKYAFVSHHIGDMENYETLNSFKEGIDHFERLFNIHPDIISYDLHPDYLSTRYAVQRAREENLSSIAIQHHHAHIASCMADNGLDGSYPVIGLSFDGTGYGTDGAIWGGEFLVADYENFERKYHLAYFPIPGGDKTIKHPARIALSLLHSLGLEWDEKLAPVGDISFEERTSLRIQLERGVNVSPTSSLGRLFDAVAALSNVRQRVNYEAQAAMELEALVDETVPDSYKFEIRNETISVKDVIAAIIADVFAGVALSIVSSRFHNGLVDLARSVCDLIRTETGIKTVVLSGGVWQNMVFLERVTHSLLRDRFYVYTHRNLPTNDGGLSLGQVMVSAARVRSD